MPFQSSTRGSSSSSMCHALCSVPYLLVSMLYPSSAKNIRYLPTDGLKLPSHLKSTRATFSSLARPISSWRLSANEETLPAGKWCKECTRTACVGGYFERQVLQKTQSSYASISVRTTSSSTGPVLSRASCDGIGERRDSIGQHPSQCATCGTACAHTKRPARDSREGCFMCALCGAV